MIKIKQLLNSEYSLENFNKFILDFFNEIERLPYIEKGPISSFKNTIKSYAIVGTYNDNNGNSILILSVNVKDNSQAKHSQRNFVSHLLQNELSEYDAAFVAFYDDSKTNWKLSFIKVEMILDDQGIKFKYQPVKRYSFLVGEGEPSKTYLQQLTPIYESSSNPTLNEISDAFSVSKLSNYFYEDYKEKYFQLVDILMNNEAFLDVCKIVNQAEPSKFVTTFVKKTLGQIVFLHFVQKKGSYNFTIFWIQ